MRRSSRFFSLMFLVAAVAGAAPAAASAQAVTETTMFTIPLDNVALTCPDEVVILSGEATVLFHGTINATGGQSAHFRFLLDDVTAVGAESGTVYAVQGVTTTGFTMPGLFLDPVTADVTRFVQTWLLVPEGGGKPLSFQETTIAVFNPDFELVAFHFTDPQCD
jgi:hypothetical protein